LGSRHPLSVTLFCKDMGSGAVANGMVNPEVATCEPALIQSLTSTPAHQWGALLEVLGTGMTVRPVESKSQVDAPCTVTSLLGMMGAEHAVQPTVTALAAQSASSRSPSSTETLAQTLGTQQGQKCGRQRGRRGQQQSAPVAAPAEEDTRDLDQLLRELGEPPATSSKAKAKAKVAPKRARDAPPDGEDCRPASSAATSQSSAASAKAEGDSAAARWKAASQRAPVVQKLSRVDEQVVSQTAGDQSQKCDGEEGSQKTTHQNAEAIPALEVENDAESSADAWQVVGSRLGRRHAKQGQSGHEFAVDSVATQVTVGPPEERTKSNATQSETPEVRKDQMSDQAVMRSAMDEQRTVDAPASPASQDVHRPVCTAAAPAPVAAAVAVEPVDEGGGATGIVGDGDACGSTTLAEAESPGLKRSKSEGALPDSCQDVPSAYHKRPSVGTWLGRSPMLPWVRTDVADNDPSDLAYRSCSVDNPRNPFELGNGSSPSNGAAWHHCPSVGSWLRPRADKEPQLFPATPESTPPASPRPGTPPQVVWVPVPLHLLGEVQDLLCRAGAMGLMQP